MQSKFRNSDKAVKIRKLEDTEKIENSVKSVPNRKELEFSSIYKFELDIYNFLMSKKISNKEVY